MASAPVDIMKNVDAPEETKPRFLNEEQMHARYSLNAANKHYENVVYYRQRKGGSGWFHGRVSNSFRSNYDQIDWSK